MKKVFYMNSRKMTSEDKGKTNIDKIGGLPTHKSLEFPKYWEENEYGFIMQIYCDKEKFPGIEGVLCWHIYQEVDEEDDPILVEIPIGAELNINNKGTQIKRLEERVIYYEEGFEPDILVFNSSPVSSEESKYYNSKIGGTIPETYINSDKEFIGWIKEYFNDDTEFDDFNFGGTINLFKNKNNKLEMLLES